MFPDLNFFGLHVPTYFLVISIASMISSLWFLRRAEAKQLPRVDAIDLTLVALACGFLGARVFHVFYEDPWFYKQFPWAALQIWNGGFVYFGGVLGAFLGSLVYCQIKSEPFWFWLDLATPPISLGYAIGRLACFLNGCCYGRECTVPWGIHLHGALRHPTQIYAVLTEVALLGLLLWSEKRLRLSGQLFHLWLLGHGLGRLLMEAFRDDPRGHEISGYSISTWISVGFILYATWALRALLFRPSEH